MSVFTLWAKDGMPPRLYFQPNTTGNAYLALLKSGEPRINTSNPSERNQLYHQVSTGVLMHQAYRSFDDFIKAIEAHGHKVQSRSSRPQTKSDYANVLSPQALHQQALELKLDSIKFLQPKSRYTVTLDTREPSELSQIFSTSGIQLRNEALSCGDIRISNAHSSDELIIERKTVSDLYSSIVSNHAHRQAESLCEYQSQRASQGFRTQIYWLIEGEEQGSRMLYNSFEKMVQTDGVINYFSAILGQGVLQTFNMQHTSYLALKLAQGFHEQELVYKVNEKARKTTSTPSTNYHGVRGDKNVLLKILMAIPSIREPVAHQIIAKGHKMADVLQYTKSQWLSFDGVGTTTADKIISELAQI